MTMEYTCRFGAIEDCPIDVVQEFEALPAGSLYTIVLTEQNEEIVNGPDRWDIGN